MPDFNLNDEDIHKLQRRFYLFKRERNIIHNLLDSYVADYRQFSGPMSKRYEYLRKKYISQSPDLTHLILLDGNILWATQDISIVLGRHITSIIRSINKLELSEGWCSRLLSIRETTKNQNGRNVQVYHKEIFDLLLDLYEDEYLLRFSQPRRGDNNSAHDILELRRFWQYLKDFYNFNSHVIEQHKHLPDIPPMSWKDILSLIWHKVFSLKVSTVASFIFAVCFELARRYFGFSLWLNVIPATVAIISAVLIHNRKFSPDTLSDLGAGAIFFLFLWVSALSWPDNGLKSNATKNNIILTPVRSNNNSIHFQINSNIPNVKEFLFRISPDKSFHSTGFLRQFNPNTNLPYPAMSIQNNISSDLVEIDVKFIDDHDTESSVWHFSFDVAHELFKLNKYFILNPDLPWVSAEQYKIFTTGKVTSNASLSPFMFSKEIRSSIKHLLYGINNEFPDREVDFNDLDPYEPYVLFRTNDDSIRFVSSQIIFIDGSSSDIRISNITKTID